MNKQFLFIMSLNCMMVAADTVSQKTLLKSHFLKAIQKPMKNMLVPSTAMALLKKEANLLVITRKNTRPSWQQSDKKEVQQILASFADIMQCFFKIVQDPENRQNVTLGIAGMLANIVQAGKVIMRGTDILMDSDKKTVEEWLTTIHLPTREICTMITRNNK
jgi:hypothetical protein